MPGADLMRDDRHREARAAAVKDVLRELRRSADADMVALMDAAGRFARASRKLRGMSLPAWGEYVGRRHLGKRIDRGRIARIEAGKTQVMADAWLAVMAESFLFTDIVGD